jgi:hypothetical protein
VKYQPATVVNPPKNWIETPRINAVLRRLGAPPMESTPMFEFYRKHSPAALRALSVGIEKYYEQKEAQE